LTSANGEVLARCSTEPRTERLFRAADLINADGQPLVTVSRFKSSTPCPSALRPPTCLKSLHARLLRQA
jgi:N-acetylglucosaminyldiphosphoundecaprenol N-acetyl-beta-D-mannosaminyltransferase